MGLQTYTIELKMDIGDEQHEAMSQAIKQVARNLLAVGMLLANGKQPMIEDKDGSKFSKDYLAQFDAVFFYTTGDLCSTGTDKQPATAPDEVIRWAVEDMIADKPGDFVKMVAGLVPKEATLNINNADDLSDAQLAERIGVHYQTIGYIERGEYSPSLVLALQIAKVLGEPIGVVFSLDEE